MVMAYVFVNHNFRSVDDMLQPIEVTIAGSNTTANSIYVNRQEIDSWIVSQSLNETMHSAAVMIRIDEYNYWFNNGTQAYNLANIVKTIPRVYSPPEL
jgi:hypothetical protein